MTTKRALVCAPVAPEFDRESGSRRIFHLIELLREDGWAVTFLAQNEASGGRHMRMLRQLGVATLGEGNRHIEQLVSVGRFDLAIVAFWHLAAVYLPKIRARSPSTRVIVDSIDVHFLRQARHVFRARRPNEISATLGDEYAREMVGEINTYAAADAVLTVSAKEADLLNDLLSDPLRPRAHAVPDCEMLTPLTAAFEDRRGILFLGNFRHPPNIDALEYLIEQIAPRLDASLLARHPIMVVGNGVTDAVKRVCESHRHVQLVGWVPDVMPYFERARVSVVPLRYGAGTKRKLIQALMLGTPSVTTSIGAEGLNLRSRRDILIADDPDAFANAIGELLRNAPLWRKLSNNGQAVVRASHDRGLVKARFLKVLTDVFGREPGSALEKDASRHSDLRRREYRATVRRVREIVEKVVPAETTLLVVSKGDADLVSFSNRIAWHFPRNGTTGYAGYYPADSAGAIQHLELMRTQGAQFMVFPRTARWWLSHYAEFRVHLDETGRVIWSDEDCQIYQLGPSPAIANDSRGIAPGVTGISTDHPRLG
jgi:glycosyltransferase involved in cell wall biosynthesis